MTNTLVPTTNLTKNADSDFTTEGNLPVMESQLMSIDMANAAFIMDSLTNLYSDPYFSVAREYIANAIDSHIDAGNTAPVEVTAPSSWSPNLVIKDQGIGMSQDDVFRYGTYGSSDKRENLKVVGNFGMGSKSALAITNSFTITAIKDGEYTMATIGRNDEGFGQVDIILHEPTTEPNGVTITIPITSFNIYTMQNKINDVIQYLPGGTVELDGTVNKDIRENLTKISDDVHINTFDWGNTYFGISRVYIVSGGFGYRVPSGEIYKISDEFSDKELIGVPKEIYIDVPTGSVDLTPSREQLRMTARTTTLIQDTIRSVLTECSAKYAKKLDSITTFEEVYSLVADTNSHNRLSHIVANCGNLEIPRSDNMIAESIRSGNGIVTARHRSNLNKTIAEDMAFAVGGEAIVLDLDKDYSENSLTTRVKSFLTKVTEDYTSNTPVIILNPNFKDDPNSTKDNLYRYIVRSAVRMKASEIYSAVNEYNKQNRAPSTGYSAGKGDDAEIESAFINGDDITKGSTHFPTSGTMKKFFEDRAGNDRDFIYILNNPRSSGNTMESSTIISVLALQKLYDESYKTPNVVLINGGVRKAKYFSQRGMDVVSVSDFMDSYKTMFQDKKTISGLKDVYAYLQGKGSNFGLDSVISRIKVAYPGAAERVEKIETRIYPQLPEDSEDIVDIVKNPYQVISLLHSIHDWTGSKDDIVETIRDFEQSIPLNRQDRRVVHSMMDTTQVLLDYGHAEEAYAMLDQTVDLLDKKED